ncbi:tetratricopeptide repeat protein [uncultured Prevotella sp.]|uniref:tetratricopeptide repeat protein n=1 Tax=uncultured Prevotella sp. TaxID=159272 RepID=UPI0025D7704A|nr:tetratricopeptide repeat protein [uncultured Prevotella sp.]
MKKIFVLVFTLSLAIMASYAQMQHGIVKTRGRMVNGKLVPGEMIAQALVGVRGRSAVLSGNDGAFSFPVTTKSFIIDSVKKKDYTLIDIEACRQYQYPQEPFVLLMEKPELQQADLLANERRLRRDLQKRLQKREDEVDALNVSLEEKNKLLQEINREREDNEKIIKELAKYYATLDYDQLNDFQRRVCDCLENGELERADSLLRSRGDMRSRIEAVKAEQAAEAKEKEYLAQRQKDLKSSKEGTNKRIEDIAADCFSFYQRFGQDHQRDSAAYYLELRTSLDTTNLEWSIIAGKYISDYLADYAKALKYYQTTLRQSFLQFGEQHEWTAIAYNDIGLVYSDLGNYPKALEYTLKALVILEKVLGQEHPDIATSYNNIGGVYSDQGDYPKAMEYLLKALVIREKVLGQEHPDVATSYNNIGYIYFEQGDYPKALEYYLKALAICEKVLGQEHPNVATSYNNIGLVYKSQGDYPKALENLLKALAIREKVLGQEHPDVATSYNNIGYIYFEQGDYPKALDYYLKALAIWEKVQGQEHSDVATSYNNIGLVYSDLGNYPKAMEYLLKALVIREKVLGQEHPDVATSYNNIGSVYDNLGDYPKALEYYLKALAICEKVLGQEHPKTRTVRENIEYVKEAMIVQDPTAMQDYVFTATVVDGDTPARQQGLSGEYIMLEFADWTIKDATSLYKKNDEMRGKPKDIVIIKDNIISQHHFENTIGVQFGLKQVGKEEKERIIQAYEQWKKEHQQ